MNADSDNSQIRTEEQKASLLTRLELALSGAKFGVWEFDLQSQRLIWDARMYSIYHCTAETFDGSAESWKSHVFPEDRHIVDEKFNQLSEGHPVEIFEFRIINPENQEIGYIEANGATEWDANGKLIRLVGLNRDITKKKLIEMALDREKEARISAAKMIAVGEMSAGIAHEINNPLALVFASSFKIRNVLSELSGPKEIVKEMLDRIDSTIERISKIVKGLQHLSRTSMGDELEEISLAQIIEQVTEISRSRFNSEKIQLKMNLDEKAKKVMARPSQISEVLINLLNNSCDAIGNMDKRWIEINLKQLPESVLVEVIDSGSGIAKPVRDQMMQMFFTTKPVGKGTGLGLSISKAIMDDHGGTLNYDPVYENTRFALNFPTQV